MRTFEGEFYPAASYGDSPYNNHWGSTSYHAGGGGDYTQQEAEFDRMALLDPLWEIQQRKTFIAWINSHLRKAGTSIENFEDFQNGLKLMLLLEVISGEPLPRPDRGKTRFHRIANVNKALEYIQRKGVKLVSLGAEEIVDGNQKMVLGLIWTLILRFAIENISVGQLSARDGLLLWCQRKTEPYDNVDVQNFSTSWKDGLAFCALIHRHRPELIDYEKLDERDPIGNLNLAFDVAEKELDIPRMLDPEDLACRERPDEKSIMTYVSALYHHFEDPHDRQQAVPRMNNALATSINPDERTLITVVSVFYHRFAGQNKLEKAANRIGRVLDTNRDNQKLMDEFGADSGDLLAWIDRWRPWLKNREDEGTLNGVKQKLDGFRTYRRAEKPPRIDQKGQLETLFNTLQTRLRLSNRPPFVPPDGRNIKDINDAWKDLEDSEVGFEAWLLSEMMRLQRLDQLVEKFNRKCALHDEWANGKDRMLTSTDYKSSDVYKIKALRRRHEAFESELGSHQERAEQIVAIAKELGRLRYSRMDEINKKSLSVCTQWERLGKLAAARKEKLEQMEAIAAELDQLQLQFAKAATPFNNWIDSVREDLTDLVIVSEMGEIETLREEHEKFKATLPAAEKTLREIQNIEQKIQRLIQTHDLDPDLLRNPYADLSLSTLNAHWNGLLEQIPRRDSELELERRRQEQNEKLRREFGERANAIGPSLERRLERVLAVGANGSLEDGVQELERIQQEVRGEKSKLDELERINQQMQENFVFEAIGSRYSMESLRVGYETLMTAIHRVINELRNQQLLRDAKGVGEEQLREWRSSFAHFDREKRGLDAEQLRSFLISIGRHEGVQDAKEDDPKLQQLVAQLDANKTGRVHLNALLDFLTREHADSDHVDQMEAAFRLLANGKPTISAETIRQEMAPAQAAECLRSMAAFRDANSGEFDYAAFCRSLFLR